MVCLLQSPLIFSLIVYATLFSCLLESCSCFSPRLLNFSMAEVDSEWSIAAAMWYGSPNGARTDFDLTGTAFGVVAKPGLADQLRNVGLLQIMHTRVECIYPDVAIAFHVDDVSKPYYFATLIEYEDGDGDLGAMELKQSGGSWVPKQKVWGAEWWLSHHCR